MAREGHCLFGILLGLFCVAGCHKERPPEYPLYAPRPTAYAPVEGSSNAFDTYALAAMKLEASRAPSLRRTSFYPAQRKEALKAVAGPLRLVAQASANPCAFQFSPHDPFTPDPYIRAWRLIGRSFCWAIQDACAQKDFGSATAQTIRATTFGLDLTGGSALDASLGLQVADEARRALAPSLEQLSPQDLKRLEQGLKAALGRRPPLKQTIENERLDSMLAIQSMQDAYRNKTLNKFMTELGPDVRDPIDYLNSLQPSDPKRLKFFQGLAEYTDAMARYAVACAELPACRRDPKLAPKLPPDHPWHRLAKYVTRACFPLLDENDASVARTRLFILEAELVRRRKLHMPLPSDLSGFTAPIGIDPYSGGPFIYRSNGEEFMVYSVGKDGLDNAGETDSTFTQPDLTLEKG